MKKLTPDQWKGLWHRPLMTSINELKDKTYDGEIREFWRSQLEAIQADEPLQIVDLACGNGGLAWLLNDLLNSKTVHANITGVDFANINPFKALKKNKDRYPGITFIGNTPLESMPFENSTFDVAVSQWGVEYSELEKTIPEIIRILKPQSTFIGICHHRDSDIVKSSQLALDGYYALQGDGAIFDCLLELDDCYNRVRTLSAIQQDPECRRLSIRLHQILYETKVALKASPSHLNGMEHLKDILAAFNEAPNMRKPGRKKLIEDTRDELKYFIARYEDLWLAALDKPDIELIGNLFEQAGFKPMETRNIHYEKMGDVGLAIIAQRP